MNFRTELLLPTSDLKMGRSSRVLTLGSCFADVLGQQLKNNKLTVLSNPFGTIFNPLSIFKLLRQSLENQTPDANLFVQNQDVWRHYDFHSSLWSNDRNSPMWQIALQNTGDFFKKANYLILTFGTAYGYFLKQEDPQLVANCHKTPATQFTKALLSVSRIMDDFEATYNLLKAQNPNLQVIVTVSPVRHTRDTLPLNRVSKSVLRLASHYLQEHFADVSYFPSYELLLDDLRDYRFYKPDLIHPNEVAETYIFEKFAESHFSDDLKNFVAEWAKIRQALAHRPQQAGTANHRLFLENLLQKLEKISTSEDARAIGVMTEIEQVKAELAKF